jgi:hypothetical protein
MAFVIFQGFAKPIYYISVMFCMLKRKAFELESKKDAAGKLSI